MTNFLGIFHRHSEVSLYLVASSCLPTRISSDIETNNYVEKSSLWEANGWGLRSSGVWRFFRNVGIH